MITVGLDFDNNLISYDDLFHKVALEKKLIPINFPKQKVQIRDYLRSKNLDDKFTTIQAEVYGNRILEAEPSKGVIKALLELRQKNVGMYIVSHKTQYPYKGPKYNLHESAIKWLEKNNFFDSSGLKFTREDVFFEVSKLKKVNKIHDLECTHFIDDLPEILELINSDCSKILYNPFNKEIKKNRYLNLKKWDDLKNLIKIDYD